MPNKSKHDNFAHERTCNGKFAAFENAACSAYRYQSGEPELVIGFFSLIFAVAVAVFSLLSVDIIYTLIVAVILAIAAIPFVRSVRGELLIPFGACLPLFGEKKDEGGTALVLAVAYVAFCAVGCYPVTVTSALVAISTLIALFFCFCFYKSGEFRFFISSIIVMVMPCAMELICGSDATGWVWGLTALVDGFALIALGGKALGANIRSHFATAKLTNLVELLSSEDAHVRYLVLGFLCNYIEPRMIDCILLATRDSEPAVAWVARVALSRIWGPEADDMLEAYMKTSVNLNGKNQAYVLEDGDFKIVKMQEQNFAEKSQKHQREVQECVAAAMKKDPSLFATLIGIARGMNNETLVQRCVAIELLGSTHDHRAYAELTRLIASGEQAILNSASGGFCGASAEAVVHLFPLPEGPSYIWQGHVIGFINLVNELKSQNDSSVSLVLDYAREELVKLSKSQNAIERAFGITALSFYKDADEFLREGLKDKSRMVRCNTLAAFSRNHSGPELEPIMLAGLSDSSAHVRFRALQMVKNLRAPSAIPHVIRLAQSETNAEVRRLAQKISVEAPLWLPRDVKNAEAPSTPEE